jgi:hypothetical protein
MASSEKKVTSGQTPTATTTEVYTAPTSRVSTIRKFLITNQSGGDENIDIHIANDGGAAATTNIIAKQETVGASETRAFNLAGKDIPQGGKLYIKGDNSNASNYDITFDERSQNVDAEV